MQLFSLVVEIKKNKKQTIKQIESKVIVFLVDELYEQASDLTDKEVMLKGKVMHVCKHGGQRCFIMGSNEDINIRIEAGEKNGVLDQELMGSDNEIIGILKEIKTGAEAHSPGQQANEVETDGKHQEDKETENTHKVIVESQDGSKVFYIIEGLKSKEF